MRGRILGLFAYCLISLWTWFWRYRVHESELLKADLESGKPIVFAHWHGDEISLLPLIRPYRVATMTSTSKDGEIMDQLVHRVGGKTSRGSSTRGAVSALKGLVRLVRNGRTASMAVDGPKGPVFKVKPGALELARIVKAPIYCCGVSVDRAIHFEKAWNKTYLALPFAKVFVHWEGPFYLDKSVDPRDEAVLARFEDHLNVARQKASQGLADWG